MAPIRVVHVLHTLDTGGMEKGVTTLVAHASPEVRHSILCLTTSGAMAKRLPPDTPVIEMHKAPGNSPRFLWKLSRKLKELRPDVIHTRNWGGLDGVIAARLFGHRGVVHGEHGWEMADVAGANNRRRKIRRFLSRWVREYTCVSRDIEEWLKSGIGVRRPVTQIYNGVDTDQLKPGDGPSAIRTGLGLSPDSFVVGIVGRLDPIKDHPTLFRAVAALRAGGVDAELLVVGDGPERDKLESLAGDGVHLLGNRTDVADLLGAMDAFVLSSINEGISNTILEAMSSGLPVITTRVGGNPELVDDGRCGVLVDVGDDAAITQALARYAGDREFASEHGRAARAKALERFSIRQMVDAYEAVWSRVAGVGSQAA